MDGRTLDAGAITGVRGVRNPVLLARAVMEKSEHVFLIGEGAERFAREHGISFEDAEYFLTEARIAQLAEAKKKQAIVLDHSQANERKLGTVGAVARDKSGNLAAATSTGGLVNQQWGRVGNSAIIGAPVHRLIYARTVRSWSRITLRFSTNSRAWQAIPCKTLQIPCSA